MADALLLEAIGTVARDTGRKTGGLVRDDRWTVTDSGMGIVASQAARRVVILGHDREEVVRLSLRGDVAGQANGVIGSSCSTLG